MKVTIERSKRKTMMMRLVTEGELLVKVPKQITSVEIKNFIAKNNNWIQKQVKKFQKHNSDDWKPLFQDGGLFFVFGELYTLKIAARSIYPVIKHKTIHVGDTVKKSITIQVTQAYKKLAREYFQAKLIEYATITNFTYSDWKLKNNKTNWGSCSSKKNINLNWRLIMAPPEVIDYVIIHELCHLKQMNHSEKFWLLVTQFDPQWKEHSNWLKVNGYLLHSI
jgi:predicted metal-dependent hydrolase